MLATLAAEDAGTPQLNVVAVEQTVTGPLRPAAIEWLGSVIVIWVWLAVVPKSTVLAAPVMPMALKIPLSQVRTGMGTSRNRVPRSAGLMEDEITIRDLPVASAGPAVAAATTVTAKPRLLL